MYSPRSPSSMGSSGSYVGQWDALGAYKAMLKNMPFGFSFEEYSFTWNVECSQPSLALDPTRPARAFSFRR